MMDVPRDRWWVVLDADEVPVGRPVGVTRLGMPLVFWRDAAGIVRATSDVCPHRGAALSQGRLHDGDVACPFHGFRFRGVDGQCTAIPAQGSRPPPKGYAVDAFVVREAHGFIWLWLGDGREDLPDIPWFADLDAPGWSWRAGRVIDDWDIHWTRVVENQLDFTHLPFVHQSTIGRFVGEEMDVVVEGDGGDFMKAYVRGQSYGVLELHAPNLWRNRLGANTYGLAAFVPIDERSTRTYIRYVQRDVPWPVLRDLYGWLMAPANLFILRQDRRIVTRQRPSEAAIGEKLVASDAAIIWFRRWRRGRARVDGDDTVT